MTLRYIQGWDYLTTALAAREGNFGNPGTIDGLGRFGNGLQLPAQHYSWTWFGDGGTPQASVVVGFAFQFASGSYADWEVVTLMGSLGEYHVSVYLSPANHLYVDRSNRGLDGGYTNLAGPGAKTLLPGVWYYIELKATINDTTGSFTLRVDGAVELTGSSVDTHTGTGPSTCDHFMFSGWGNTGNRACHYDDVYFLDNQGSVNNDFLGDIRVVTLFPNGNGNSSVLVNDGANSTNNYTHVDETTSNDDTDYVESATVGDKDTYAFTDLPMSTGTVVGVRPILVARKSDAGSRSVCSVARLSTTEVDGPNKVLSTSYQNLSDVRETKPGGGAWTISDVNSAEFGMKVTV